MTAPTPASLRESRAKRLYEYVGSLGVHETPKPWAARCEAAKEEWRKAVDAVFADTIDRPIDDAAVREAKGWVANKIASGMNPPPRIAVGGTLYALEADIAASEAAARADERERCAKECAQSAKDWESAADGLTDRSLCVERAQEAWSLAKHLRALPPSAPASEGRAETNPRAEQDARLRELVKQAQARFDALSPEEQEAEMRAQRDSWVRGQIAMGNDADEARYRDKRRAETEERG